MIIATLAVTFLNPHVYLDTVVMLGSISSSFSPNKLEFALGAMSASAAWFLLLTMGGQSLSGLFKSKKAWRVLDTGLGLIMLSMAFSLAAGA